MEQVSQPRSQREGDSQTRINNEEHKRLLVPRKPVPIRVGEETQSKEIHEISSTDSQHAPDYLTNHIKRLDLDSEAPVLPPRSYPSIDTAVLSIDNDLARSDTKDTVTVASPLPTSASSPPDTIMSPGSSLSTASSYTQKAYREVRHFAGGLIHHPSQRTKHFSVLRHSHGSRLLPRHHNLPRHLHLRRCTLARRPHHLAAEQRLDRQSRYAGSGLGWMERALAGRDTVDARRCWPAKSKR